MDIHEKLGNIGLVAQTAFEESIQSHPEGMAIAIYPQENKLLGCSSWVDANM